MNMCIMETMHETIKLALSISTQQQFGTAHGSVTIEIKMTGAASMHSAAGALVQMCQPRHWVFSGLQSFHRCTLSCGLNGAPASGAEASSTCIRSRLACARLCTQVSR